MACEYNFEVDVGASWTITIQFKDGNGNVIPLTGYTVTMTIQTPTPLILDNAGHGGIVVTGATGTIVPTLTSVQTGALVPGRYAYTLQAFLNATNAPRLLEGSVFVNA